MASVAGVDSNAVERLKAEANALHREGSYQAAYQKYSEAIKEKPDKAVLSILYANRAASCLALKEYMDGFHDGQNAAKLDPTYVKAWARMGTAAHVLGMWSACRYAWQSALACLPTANLTDAQLILERQFKEGIKAADAAEAKSHSTAEKQLMYLNKDSSAPWDRALALAEENQLVEGELPSSGFVILDAYRDFVRGIKAMQQIVINRQGDNLRIKAIPNALIDITNGLLRDTRVFHADSRFFEQLEAQIRYEGEATAAWGSGGPKRVQKEAIARQRKEGWLPVRRALSVTVRAWIIKGFIDTNMGSLISGVEFYQRTLDLLEWGRRTWHNVASEDRGIIFEASFVRGVRRLHLPAVLRLYLKEGVQSGVSLETIANLARELMAETEASVRPPDYLLNPGFYASFWIYPAAEALSIIGWYHMQLGLQRIDSKLDLDQEAVKTFRQASQYYIQAADRYPEDEEERPSMLAVALEALWWSETPLRETLPLCRRIRAAMSKSATLWKSSQKSVTNQNAKCKDAVQFLIACEKELAEGTATLDSTLVPTDLSERRASKIAQIRDDL